MAKINTKTLDNPLVTIGIIITLAVAGIFLWRYCRPNMVIDHEESKNPNFRKLMSDIYELKEWNRVSFGIKKENISQYASVSPTPLINKGEAKNLTYLLETRYLELLSDTIINFCRMGSDLSRLNELNNAVKEFQNTEHNKLIAPMQENINTYYSALNICNTIYDYTQLKFDEAKYRTLELNLRAYNTMAYISKNTFIMEKHRTTLRSLIKHATLKSDFERKVNEHCDCQLEYGDFRYYMNLCKCLQDTSKVPCPL